jgi:Zn-dependent peptidase ImmA (M78 family)
LRVVAGARGSARLIDSCIEVDTTVRIERQHGLVAHELGHWALRRAGELDTEQAASYVGAALLLPRRQFLRDLSTTRWDLRELRAKHVHCSAELMARRIVAVRDAVVSIWDGGRLKTRLASPWLPESYRRMSRFERELAAEVLATGETIEAGQLVWGFAVFDGVHRRVITVCEAEQLALRY